MSNRASLKKILAMIVIIVMVSSGLTFAAVYTNEAPYKGFPKRVTLDLSDLDTSGSLIYVGVDLAVFQDEDDDGDFHVMNGKVKRALSRHTNVTLDLGNPSDYKKGKLYKLAMRTLYVPTGTNNDTIVIADYDNGKQGWVLIPNTVFKPTYFASSDDNPYIQHTVKWEANRISYNTSKAVAGLSTMERSSDTFWSGEKFVLHIETNEAVPTIKVSIKDTTYSKTLTATTITSGCAIYQGELWDEEMLNEWGNYIPKELTFTIAAMDGDTVLETFDVPIIMDNRDLYYRNKKEY